MKPALFVRVGFEVCMAIAVACAVPAVARVEGSFERSLKVSGPVDIDINTGSGTITVHAGGSDRVEVRGRIRASDWSGNGREKVRRLEADPPIQQSGNSIHIGHIEDPELRRNVSISYELTVPAETEMKAHSGSGNQTVDGIRGPVEINAGSGSVRISNIGDTVRADTGSGNIDIDRVKGNVRAHAGSGSIRATDVAGGFQANTGSGPDREGWNCAGCAGRWKPAPAAEISAPKEIRPVAGSCIPARVAFISAYRAMPPLT